MADNFTQFSEIVEKPTPEELVWLNQQTDCELLRDAWDQIQEQHPDKSWLDDDFPKGVFEQSDLVLLRHYVETEDLGFEAELDDEGDFWIWDGGGFGDPDRIVVLVQAFLKRFRPEQCWSMLWADTCTRPRIREFAGGGAFVTADAVTWIVPWNELGRLEKEFRSRKTVETTR